MQQTTKTDRRPRLTVEDVPAWLVSREKIGCILLRTLPTGWHSTACGTMTPSGTVKKDGVPDRKCKKCMKALKDLVPHNA